MSEEILWPPPKSADELESARGMIESLSGPIMNPTLSIEESEERLMRAAVLSYPICHSEWANRMEPVFPILRKGVVGIPP